MAWVDGNERGRRLTGEVRALRPTLGTFLNMGSPLSAEACAIAGFDWVLVDLEHGGGGEDSVAAQLLAAAAHGVPTLVRVESLERIRTGRILDLGANGVMFPRIDSREDAIRAAAHLHYPPRGDRGVATYNRSAGFGRHPEVLDTTAESLLCVVQIETTAALEDVEDIAAVPGVDVCFVGPRDLTQALGVPGETSSSTFLQASERVVAACSKVGVAAGIMVGSAADAERYFKKGYRFIALSSDSSILAAAAASAASAARAACAQLAEAVDGA